MTSPFFIRHRASASSLPQNCGRSRKPRLAKQTSPVARNRPVRHAGANEAAFPGRERAATNKFFKWVACFRFPNAVLPRGILGAPGDEDEGRTGTDIEKHASVGLPGMVGERRQMTGCAPVMAGIFP